jgi:exopolysaccharide biosynthesis polyprenyl glycosylphosphotransferase
VASLPRRRRYALTRLIIDGSVLALACVANSLGARAAHVPSVPVAWVAVYCAAVLIAVAARGGYRFRLQSGPLDQLGQVYVSSTLAVMVVVAARVAVDHDTSRLATQSVRLWLLAGAFMAFGRVSTAIALQRPDVRGLNTLIVGAGSIGQLIARRLAERPELGLRPVGFLDKEPRLEEGVELPVLGASWDLEQVVEAQEIEHVIVTFSTAPHEVLLGLVRRCRKLGVEISLVPRLFEEVSNRVAVEHLGSVALLRVDQADPRGWQFDVKYGLDRVLAAIGVVVFSPILLALAATVKLSSRGPVFFRQRRVGLDGHEFDMLKFRTMREPNAGEVEDWAARALGSPDAPPRIDRRTPLGRVLRRLSIDELPQLFNVLRGDMSLVGPRPELPGYVETFERQVYRYGDRHRVKSGLTGWAQVNGLRGDTSLQDRAEWDNFYVENWTPWLDLKILLRTPGAALSGHGAE